MSEDDLDAMFHADPYPDPLPTNPLRGLALLFFGVVVAWCFWQGAKWCCEEGPGLPEQADQAGQCPGEEHPKP